VLHAKYWIAEVAQSTERQPSPNLRIATVGKARLRLAKQGAGQEKKKLRAQSTELRLCQPKLDEGQRRLGAEQEKIK